MFAGSVENGPGLLELCDRMRFRRWLSRPEAGLLEAGAKSLSWVDDMRGKVDCFLDEENVVRLVGSG